MSDELSRREFLRKSTNSAVGIGVGLAAVKELAAQDKPAGQTGAQPGPAQKPTPASEKIVLGFIGVAGRGTGLLNTFRRFKDVEVAAVCDVYEAHRERALKLAGSKAQGYNDYREMLDRKDIDAVVIATPVHWHALPSIHACQAGKDVYVEKPMTHNIVEGRAMIKAARENKRVVQMGTQIHAGPNYRRVVEIIRTGVLGKITLARTWMVCNESPNGIGKPKNEPPPKGLDWDLWLGPAPESPFNRAKFYGGHFRYFWDYGGGWITAMGPHIIDLVYWALDLEGPIAVAASGGRLAIDDMAETPDTQHVIYDFPGLTMIWSHSSVCSYGYEFQGDDNAIKRRLGIMFHGANGSLAADYGTYHIFPEGSRMPEKVEIPKPTLPPTPGHYREFLDSIRSRKLTSCDVEYAHRVTTACHLGNIALRVGRKIYWDAKNERIIDDEEANKLLGREYRAPWRLPT